MYKKICLLLLVASLSVSAQEVEEKIDKIAKNATERMKIALSLSDEEEDQVYQIQRKKFEEIFYAKEDNAGQHEVIRNIIKNINKKNQKIFRDLLGEERFKKWPLWLKSNRKNVDPQKVRNLKIESLAQKITIKMVEVLKLNREEKSKVFKIQLEKYKTIEKLKFYFKTKTPEWSNAVKKVNNETQEKFRVLLGKDRFKKWSRWNKTQRNKNKKIV